MQMLVVFLVLLVLLLILPSNAGSISEAAVNSTWTKSPSGDAIILFNPRGIFCGFTNAEESTDLFLFAVFTRIDVFNGDYPSYMKTVIVWSPSGNFRVPWNSTLSLRVDGNLVLANAEGYQVWESGTKDLGVVGIRLTSAGNLVLLNKAKVIVWSSFGLPLDTLINGQPLRVGMKLVSRISERNLSDGYFYLQVEHERVALYAKVPSSSDVLYGSWCSHPGIAFIALTNGTLTCYNESASLEQIEIVRQPLDNYQYLRLFPNGDFKFMSSRGEIPLMNFHGMSKKRSPCGAFPGACGIFGICSHFHCTCPLNYRFIEQNFPELGCFPTHPPVCSSQILDNELVELSGMDNLIGHLQQSTTAQPLSECKQSCLANCSCKAVVHHTDSDECFQLGELYTIWNATEYDEFKSSMMIKVASYSNFSKADHIQSRHPRSRSNPQLTAKISIAVSSVAFVALFIGVIKTCWSKKVRKRKKKNFVPCVPNLPKQIKYQQLCTITANFSKQLGQGGFGIVFEGILPEGIKVAVKRLETARHGKTQFEAEVATIGSIHHSNLVKLKGYGAHEPYYFLVYEFVANLSLDKWLFGNNNQRPLSWEQRYNIALDIARGIMYLHEQCQERVLHLDIKPQNILLDSNFKAKICDFGLSKLIDKDASSIDTIMRGTPGYMAPEWLQSEVRVTEKTDVYSFGIVLLEIVSGQKATCFSIELSTESIINGKAFVEATKEALPRVIDKQLQEQDVNMEELQRVIRVGLWCTRGDPAVRPSIGTAMKMLEGCSDVPDLPVE